MRLPAEQLAAIDEELASFGKSDEQLAAVVDRAIALASSLAGDDGLAELLEGREEALAAAREAAQASLPERPAPLPDRPPVPVVESEPPPPTKEPVAEAAAKAAEETTSDPEAAVAAAVAGLEDDEDEEDEPTGDFGADMLELSEEEPSEGSLPPLELVDSEPPPAALEASSDANEQIEAAFGEEASSDIAGLSVDELFADAEPESASTASSGDISGLFAEQAIESMLEQTEEPAEGQRISAVDISDLFDDEEENEEEEIALRLSDPDLDVAPFAAAVDEPRAEAAPVDEYPAFSDENSEESTMNIHLDEMEMVSGDDFELLVDEEVLELDVDDGATPAADAAASQDGDDEDGEKKGLISRILGRK